MSRLSIKLGYWSAVVSVILAGGYILGVVLLLVFPAPGWTNLPEFAEAIRPVSLVAFTFVQAMVFLNGPAYVVLICCLHEYAPAEKKILTRIGLCCIVGTMVLGNQLYYLSFNAIRLIVTKSDLTGLDQFVEWNWNAPMTASGLLGWTFFLGLAFLFVGPIFSGGRLERWLRWASLTLGVSSLLGMLGNLLASPMLAILYLLGMTVSGTVLAVLASVLFKRLAGSTLQVPLPRPVVSVGPEPRPLPGRMRV
ncbi:MAG TPA: hypothetical protein VF518_09225 [Polyangia bacterium]